MTTIQIRIDERQKRLTKKNFEKLGLDLSNGMRLLINQFNQKKHISSLVLTENGFTEAEEQEILEAEREARAGMNIRTLPNTIDLKAFLKALK